MSDALSDADHELGVQLQILQERDAPIFVMTKGEISRVLPMKIAGFQIELPALGQR